MFKQCADIQTADMLKLPVPEIAGGKPTIVKLPPSELQRQMVAALGERAEAVRNRLVAPNEDNMLRITNDGRKLALDQRLMNPLLPDDPDSKANACVERVFTIWERTKAQRSTQMIFCDLSTPRADGFDVYNDIRDKLVARGIPKEEVQFIHDADTEAKKAELFGKVRSGAVRVLMGSTQKMGAGTNVQTRLCALHHLDCPWRPADIAQRNGRMVRQGNINKEVCNSVQREHDKKLNNGLPILHMIPPYRDYGRYFCIQAGKGGTIRPGLIKYQAHFLYPKQEVLCIWQMIRT